MVGFIDQSRYAPATTGDTSNENRKYDEAVFSINDLTL
jgi:hypothetical protein